MTRLNQWLGWPSPDQGKGESYSSEFDNPGVFSAFSFCPKFYFTGRYKAHCLPTICVLVPPNFDGEISTMGGSFIIMYRIWIRRVDLLWYLS